MITRRALIQGSISAAVVGLAAHASCVAANASGVADAQLAALLQRLAEEHLRRSPEEATRMGMDAGPMAALRAQLDDRSLAAITQQRNAAERALIDLRRIDRNGLGPAARLDYDVAVFVYATLQDQLARYGFVDINLRPSPYVVSQMNGAYYWLPEFLGARHPLQTRDDLEAYFARLSALGRVLDQETDRIAHDARARVAPPGFVLATAIAQIEALLATPPARTAMIAPAIARSEAAQGATIRERGEQIFGATIKPALMRQSAALRALQSHAGDHAGVWSLPDGEAYYASALRSNTTTSIAASQLHQRGLALAAELSAQLDASLRSQGYTEGSVGRRIDALNQNPRFVASDDDEGRKRLLAAANAALDRARELLPAGFKSIPSDALVVQRMPAAIESGAPGAFYSDGAAGEPAIFSLNLASPKDLPLWRLPTLAHHEGVPGHHLQQSSLKAAGTLPLFRRLARFSAYTEGWALYAERLAEELGAYRDDPVGRIGLQQSELFRAARIVVDTGIHHERWTRAQAIRWLIENAGERPAAAQREIDRYCVYPGQACSFMVGASELRAARERARGRMGARFDLREFHDLVLRAGPVPLDVLWASIEQWSA